MLWVVVLLPPPVKEVDIYFEAARSSKWRNCSASMWVIIASPALRHRRMGHILRSCDLPPLPHLPPCPTWYCHQSVGRVAAIMRSLAISSYTTPDNYDVMDLPTPTIESPDEVLVKVHAASINPADVHMASGIAKLMQSASLVTRSLMNEEVLTGQVSTQNWVWSQWRSMQGGKRSDQIQSWRWSVRRIENATDRCVCDELPAVHMVDDI